MLIKASFAAPTLQCAIGGPLGYPETASVTHTVTSDQDGLFSDTFTPSTPAYTLTATVHESDPVPRALSSSCQLLAGDVSITASPASQHATLGAPVTEEVTTSAVGGGPAPEVALRAAGLPNGVTATFAPPMLAAGASSALKITTSASATPGTYPITVVATGTNPVRQATFPLVITK